MKWPKRLSRDERKFSERPVLIHALEGFLGAGSAPKIVADYFANTEGEVLYSFDVDSYLDYRARRPLISFSEDHYEDYAVPSLDLVLKHEVEGWDGIILV